MRSISYAQAINEAHVQSMELSEQVMVIGQLVDYKSGIFGTTTGLVERFGVDRVQDFPAAESLMTYTAMGASLAGIRPVLVHQRLDFMLFSMEAIVNWLALWRFKSDGKEGMPVTIRAIVGKGWGQGPQHSKSLQSWFAHLPGLRVAMPATAYDAKGLLLESIFSEDPAIILEGRALFSMTDNVPEKPYRVRFGQAVVRRPGKDVTLAAAGMMMPIALRAAQTLATMGIEVEVIDLRTISPLDKTTLCESVSRTRRLVVADHGWNFCGIAAEVIASVVESLGCEMTAAPVRVTLPDSHTPMSAPLESKFYPDSEVIVAAIRTLMKH